MTAEISTGLHECANSSGYGILIPSDFNEKSYSHLVEAKKAADNLIFNCNEVNGNTCPENCPIKLLKNAIEANLPKI